MAAERVVPVVMKVSDQGFVRTVKIGQAFITDDEVVLSLEPMSLQLTPPPAVVAAPPVSSSFSSTPTPVPGSHSQLGDLEWLAQRSRRILADPRKQRWHDDMRMQLQRIEEEMRRLQTRAPSAVGERA